MFELAIIIALLVVNGVFSMAEAAVVASRQARLQQRADAGDAGAAAALKLSQDPNTFLSTVQIGITLVGIFAGAFGGATLSKGLSRYIALVVPSVAKYADSIAFFLVVSFITYLSLVIGELVPKRIALGNPEKIAARVAAPMRVLSMVAAPLVGLLGFSTNLLLKLLGVKASDEPAVTEQEIRLMVEQGSRTGQFDAKESDLVDNVFLLGDLDVGNLMTRRPEMVWLDIEDSWDKLSATIKASPYSRFPVGRGSVDKIVGVVRAKDLLDQMAAGATPDLTAIMQPPSFVPSSMRAYRFLEHLRRQRTHIAIVVDEYGGTQGVLTLQDILEALVGELPAIDESDEGYAVKREDGSYLCEGLMPLHQFMALFDLDELPGRAEAEAESLSGFVLLQLGHIPHVAECFEAVGLKFEVMDMDGQRIDKVLVERL